MRFSIYLLPFFGCLILSCNNVTEEDVQFLREEIVTQELMLLQGVTAPMRLEISHPFLMVQNWKRMDSLFHIYDLTNFELQNVFGFIGQGPEDYKLPWLYTTPFCGFLIGDGSNILYYLDVDDKGQSITKERKEIKFIEGARNAAFLNDSLFVMDADYLAPSLYLLSLQDELPRKTRSFRSSRINDKIIDPNMALVCANENRIVLCYEWKKQIDLFDTDLNLIKSIKHKYPHPPTINYGNIRDIKGSYLPSYLGKKYLYALFRGISLNEYFANPSGYNDLLEVYDLDGNPIIRYELDGVGTSHFVVDEETFMFYGIPNDGKTEDYLVMYHLTGLQ